MEALLADLPENAPVESVVGILAERINALITDDFSGLMQILYRLDVNEQKLRTMLKTHQDRDAGMVIARMILERQQEKAAWRAHFKQNDRSPDTGDEDRW